jgi:hypothetical protein
MRVIPACIGPSATSSTIIEPGTSGSASHEAAVPCSTNIPGLISIKPSRRSEQRP